MSFVVNVGRKGVLALAGASLASHPQPSLRSGNLSLWASQALSFLTWTDANDHMSPGRLLKG